MTNFTLKSLQTEIAEITGDFTFEKTGVNSYSVFCRWGEGTVGFSDAEGLKWPNWKGPLHSRTKEEYLSAMKKLAKAYEANRALTKNNANRHAVY